MSTNHTMALRPYQSGAIQGIYNYFHEDTGNPLVVIPTAGGKSLVMATFVEAGVTAKRCTSIEFYEWLLPFFNRKVHWASRHTGDLLEQLPYPGDQSPAHDADGREAAPVFGWDMADLLSVSPPVSDAEADTDLDE